MNRIARILVGAFAGALITLLIHPLSSRYLLAPVRDLGPSAPLADSAWLPRNLDVLPAPVDTLQASLWVQTGAELLARGIKISRKNLEKLVAVAEASSRGEPENAFWLQMDAVFLLELGRQGEAMQRWTRASHAISWNDYQSRRLGRVRAELQNASGGPMAWQTVAAYYQRSDAAPRTILWLARFLFERGGLNKKESLPLRLATLRNGRLLRDGSRSVLVGAYGVDLVELAAAPGAPLRTSPRLRVQFRDELVNELRDAGLSKEVIECDDAFRTNDAWTALTQPAHAYEIARNYAAASIAFATAPGVFLGLSLVGLAFFGLSKLFGTRPRLQVLLRPPWTPAFGVIAGLALYLQTGLVLAAAAVTLCFAFVAFEPTQPRKHVPKRMRLGFRLALSALAALFLLLLGGFWSGILAPSLELVPFLRLPADLFGGNSILVSLAALVVSLLFLAAPGWAIVDRVPTAIAIVMTLREFGFRVIAMSLAACLLVTPAAVYFDNQVRSSMDVLLANEPAHYLLQ